MKIITNLKYVYLSIISFLSIHLMNINTAFAVGGTGAKFTDAFNDLSSFAQKLTNGMLGFAILSGIGVLIYHIVQLALVGNNPKERSKVLKNLLVSAVCIALLGSIGLIMMFIMLYTGIG